MRKPLQISHIEIHDNEVFKANNKNIIHVGHDTEKTDIALASVSEHKKPCTYFGDGDSTQRFTDLIRRHDFWEIKKQKVFVDLES